MTTEVRKQQRVFLPLQQDLIVAIADNPSQSFVQSPLMLGIAETIDKDEVGIAVHGCRASDPVFLLILLLLEEGFLHQRKHGNLPDTVCCLRRMHIAITSIDCVAIVNQSIKALKYRSSEVKNLC